MPDQHGEFGAEPDGLREQMRGLRSGCDQIAVEGGRRCRVHPVGASRLAGGLTAEHAAAQPSLSEAAGVPGLRLVIGLDGDQRAWVQVANALLEGIARGAVRAGSREPPVTSLGLECAVLHHAGWRPFSMLAGEGGLSWVPGRGCHVRTGITVAVSDRPRPDGKLKALLLPGGLRQQHGQDTLPGGGSGGR
jgi:DNA-binding transcriptional regulator YhcF (GntR family)